MGEQLEGRLVNVGGDEIKIYDLRSSNSWFSAVYQNRDTIALDEKFGLMGDPVNKDSEVSQDIRRSTGQCSLGKTEVELLLMYFGILATQLGNFVGLPEEELRDHARKGDLSRIGVDEGCIDIALHYKDGMHDGAAYLTRMNVEGKEVLFPANLPKLIF